MNFYKLIRPLIFQFPPERAHKIAFKMLGILKYIPNLFKNDTPYVNVMGLRFLGPVGLAAGMDKNAEYVDLLSHIGFGHVEIGTVTPLPQSGNYYPRLFRLKDDRALINRMGFNNDGSIDISNRLRNRKSDIIVGGNIGKNKNTPNSQAVNDYIKCFEALHGVVDYFVVNVSSPNTPGLRDLQNSDPLLEILSRLVNKSHTMGYRPILLKVSPDLSNDQMDDMIEVIKKSGIQGIVATNTTIEYGKLKTKKLKMDSIGLGGLSGSPLRSKSTEVIKYFRSRLKKPFVIIGVGGIDSSESAMEKLDAGADLVQVYTGLVYEGPSLVSKINKSYSERISKV